MVCGMKYIAYHFKLNVIKLIHEYAYEVIEPQGG